MFYCEQLPPAGELAHLSEDETRHASQARRLRNGDVLWLFDGRGNLARATLKNDRGRSLEALVVEHRHTPAPQPTIHLACALPKGDRGRARDVPDGGSLASCLRVEEAASRVTVS